MGKLERIIKQMGLFKQHLQEIHDRDTGEFHSSVAKQVTISADVMFHHDPEFSSFFNEALTSPLFNKAFTGYLKTAFLNALRNVPDVGVDRWYDDFSVRQLQIVPQKEELDSTEWTDEKEHGDGRG